MSCLGTRSGAHAHTHTRAHPQALENPSRLLQQIIRRSVFNLACNTQLAVALRSTNFQLTDAFRELVATRSRGIISTQLIEDEFKVQKTDGQIKGSKAYRKPEIGMSSIISRKVVEERHHYKAVNFEVSSSFMGQRLPRDAFEVDRQSLSMDLRPIASTSQSPPWWSPSATNAGTPIADLYMLRDCAEKGDFELVSRAWIGELLHFSHKLLVKTPIVGGEQVWLAGLHFPDSACLVWPVAVHNVGVGRSYSYFELDLSIRAPRLLTVFSLEPQDIVGCCFEWRSWAWQQQALGASVKQWSPGIRGFLDTTGFKPLLEVASEHAWWSLPKSVLERFARECDVGLEPGGTLYDAVFRMTKVAVGGTCSEFRPGWSRS